MDPTGPDLNEVPTTVIPKTLFFCLAACSNLQFLWVLIICLLLSSTLHGSQITSVWSTTAGKQKPAGAVSYLAHKLLGYTLSYCFQGVLGRERKVCVRS